MKKFHLKLLITVLVLSLVACGQTGNGTSTDNSSQADSAANQVALDLEQQLLVGTLKLEDTKLAVTPAQSTQLLPYWQAILALEKSGTAADEEVNSVIEQISSLMTADQLAAINDLNLTVQDEMVLMNTLGLTVGPTTSSGELQSNQDGPVQSGPGAVLSGNPPAGGPPMVVNVEGGGISEGSQGGVISQSPLLEEDNNQVVLTTNGFPTPLLEALVNILQARAQG